MLSVIVHASEEVPCLNNDVTEAFKFHAEYSHSVRAKYKSSISIFMSINWKSEAQIPTNI